MKELPKNDSQKALFEYKQSQMQPELIVEKQRLLQAMAERRLKKLRKRHNDFLNRYYDYKQTELLDGPAALLAESQRGKQKQI